MRLRPLTDPLKMNGCALAILNPPAELGPPLQQAADWLAANAGEGGDGRVWRLG
ncbi:MAG: 23S rRNA (adenine(2030)-N(6))-methyltransferase RlmJ [Phenylobacterium sp.]